MKTIGLIGGISWHSTLEYYREINLETARRVSPAHNAPIHMISLDFHHLRQLDGRNDDEGVFQVFLSAATTLKRSGANLLALCANTAHRHAARLQSEGGLPLVHIADATACAVQGAGLRTVGLLGTRKTMEGSFLKGRMADLHGLRVLVPDQTEIQAIDHYIFQEMVEGQFSEAARQHVTQACIGLANSGAQAIVLGCTELPLLMRNVDTAVPMFDTTSLHAHAIVDAALS